MGWVVIMSACRMEGGGPGAASTHHTYTTHLGYTSLHPAARAPTCSNAPKILPILSLGTPQPVSETEMNTRLPSLLGPADTVILPFLVNLAARPAA